MVPWRVFAVSDDHPTHHFIGFIVARGFEGDLEQVAGSVLYFRNRGDAVRKRDELQAKEV